MSATPDLAATDDTASRQVEGHFVENGFIIIRNAIAPELSARIQEQIVRSLSAASGEKIDGMTADFEPTYARLVAGNLAERSPYDMLAPIWKDLLYHNFPRDMFLSEKLYNQFLRLIGPDICYLDDTPLTINLPGVDSPLENYLFKKYHQELWSGASVNTIQFWTPLVQRGPGGQLVVIKGSHLWGHIPHRNREPLEFPPDYEEVRTDLNVGDAIIFHTLLLHRSDPMPADGLPRIGFPCLLKNFKIPNGSFEIYKNWKILAYSDLSLVDRKLGNHYLSPFRLVGAPPHKFTGGIF